MPLHQQLQERLASNCRITRRDAEGGLPPSMPWLQELAPAVAASGGLTVGGLRAALSSADGPVQRVAEKVRACRACVLEPAWQAALLAQHMPAPGCLASVPLTVASMFVGRRLQAVSAVMW